MKEKKGVSLIVLVITIIVMVILAAAVIITISNTSIIDRAEGAVEQTNYKMLKEYAQTVWADAYASGKRTDAELSKAVTDALAASKFDTSAYIIKADKNGVQVNTMPEEWKANVTAVVAGVPIPKGFVASPYDGENTKDGGLVIYELQGNETKIPSTETHQQSLTGRNQYVWVPVEDMATFVRKDYTNPPTYELSSTYMELSPSFQQSGFGSVEEALAMYASVEEYGGFYIGRYEAGIENKRNAFSEAALTGANIYSRMGKIPYNYIPWHDVAETIYPVNDSSNTTGVVSTLIYGVQWDRTLAWFLETEAKDINENAIDFTNSTSYGNYINTNIVASDLNDGARVWNYTADSTSTGSYVSKDTAVLYPKVDSTAGTSNAWLLTTGALKSSKINNIYDMAGNLAEWSKERGGMAMPVLRGGYFSYSNSDTKMFSIANRKEDISQLENHGFRVSLYIKQ